MMALMFIMALMATNWELFKKSKSEKINLELLDLLASPQVKIRRHKQACCIIPFIRSGCVSRDVRDTCVFAFHVSV